MSLIEDLKLINIHNPHNLSREGMPIIEYIGADNGRGGHGSHWRLIIKGKAFDNLPWYQHGNLWFTKFGYENDNKAALAAALKKCKKLFPNIEMVKAPWRSTYVNKEDLDRAKAELKELKKKDRQREGYIKVIRGIGKEKKGG
jgi:hypothetical protein